MAGYFDPNEIQTAILETNLPTRAGANKEKVLAYMQHDKKASGSSITVIKCPGLGCWRADKLPMTELPALLGIEE